MMRGIYGLLTAIWLLYALPGHAQQDSLYSPPADSSLQPAWLQDTVFAALDSLEMIKNAPPEKKKLKLRLPIFVEDNRLQFHLRLPMREDLKFTFPKFIYAGPPPPYDPNVAWKRSLIIPGWGQIYNRSSWKVPFMYAGYGFMGYLVVSTHNSYKDYQRAYRIRVQDEQDVPISPADSAFIQSDPIYSNTDVDGLLTRRDNLRRNRDFYVILSLGYHLIWVLEAYINAHLKDLDVSDDLTIKVGPSLMGMQPDREGGVLITPGAKIILQLK